ncbi:MAG: hypothetical protein J1F23_05115 [Oscillospiraceae bacterium]|nr:hypothetical protein [Oscillospiraceae bacterium]
MKNKVISIILALLICVSMITIGAVAIISSNNANPAAEGASGQTAGAVGHISDTDSSDTYSSLIDLRDDSRRAGRVWADKSVFTDGITLDMDTDGIDYPTIYSESDFLHMFSALGSSQQKKNIQALDVVFILDTSASMSSQGEQQFIQAKADNQRTHYKADGRTVYDTNYNPRLEDAVDSLNNAIGQLMDGDFNRVALVTFNLGAATVLPLDRYDPTTVDRNPNQSAGLHNDEERYLTIAQASNLKKVRTGAQQSKESSGTIIPNNPIWDTDNNADYLLADVKHNDDRFPQIINDKQESNTVKQRFIDSQGTVDDWKIIEINAVSQTKSAGRKSYIGKNSITGNADYHVYWTKDNDGKDLPYIHTSAGTDTYWGILEGMQILQESDTELELYIDSAGNMTDKKPSDYDTNQDKYTTRKIRRQPIIVMLTDGAPNPNSTGSLGYGYNWWNGTGTKTTKSEITRYDAANGLLVSATAAYQKQLVEAHYFNNDTVPSGGFSDYQTLIYNIGLCMDDPDAANNSSPTTAQINAAHDGQVALAALNPSSFIQEPGKYPYFTTINGWWNTYLTQVKSGNRNGTVTLQAAGTYTMKHPSSNDITSLEYPTEVFQAEEPKDLDPIFNELMDKFKTEVFTPVDGPNDAGLDGNTLTYVDPIGKYMEVKNVRYVLLFGTLYSVKPGDLKYYVTEKQTIEENGVTKEVEVEKEVFGTGGNPPEEYYYSRQYYTIVPGSMPNEQINPSYGATSTDGRFRLSEINIYVETTGNYRREDSTQSDAAGSDQSFVVDIPSAALPIQVATITFDPDGKFLGYSTNIGLTNRDVDSDGNLTPEYYTKRKQSTPIRVIYEVGVADEILTENRNVDLTKVDATYLDVNRDKQTGQVYFYSNWFNSDKKGFQDYVATDEFTFGDPYLSFTANNANRYYVFEKSRLLFYRDDVNDNDGSKMEYRAEYNSYWLYKDILDQDGKVIGKEYTKQLKLVEDSYYNTSDGSGFRSDGYYYVMIEYYDRNGLVQYALPRLGSEFGVGVSGTRNEYLCWYNPTTEDYQSYMLTEDDAGYVEGVEKVRKRPVSSEGKYYVAAIEGGLRVGDLSAGLGIKKTVEGDSEKESLTGTAQTYYMPTISRTATTGSVTMNLYLGNNGRLAVNNTLLLVTKTTLNIKDERNAADEAEFEYTIKIPSMAGRTGYSAIKAVWEEGYGVWRTLIATLELTTNNKGFLMGTDGQVSVHKENGKEYFIYVGGDGTSSDDNSDLHTFTYFDYQNVDHDFADMLGGGTTIYAQAYLVPRYNEDGSENTGWSYAESGITSEDFAPFAIGEVEPNNIGHAITMYYSSTIAYQTESIPFNDKGEATFSLRDGEGYLFNGINSGSNYTVTETLTDDQIADGVTFRRVEHKRNRNLESEVNTYLADLTKDEGWDSPNKVETDIDKFEYNNIKYTYSVSGNTTPYFAEEVNYFNYVPKTEKTELEHSDDGYAKIGDTLTYEIYWENYEMENRVFVPATVTVVDWLDDGVDFISADVFRLVKGDDGETYERVEYPQNGWTYNYEDHTVTWTINAEAQDSGYVQLKVKINENADKYWNDYETPEGTPPEYDFEVLNKAGVQVNDHRMIYTEIVETGTGAPHKTEILVGDTEVSEGNGNLKEDATSGNLVGPKVEIEDEITYTISYVNYKNAEATVTVTDRLDPGVDFVSASCEGVELTAVGSVDKNDITITYDEDLHTVTWKIKNAAPFSNGMVTLVVKVNENASDAWSYKDGGIEGEPVIGESDYEIFNRASVAVDDDPAKITETVENPMSLIEFPNVGGVGRTPFYLTGILLVLAGGAWLFSRRRRYGLR